LRISGNVASPADHPTVKPLALMRWLVRLITPSGGRVLDPFAGSGTTLLAAELEGRTAIGIEQNAEYCDIIRKRLAEQRKADGLFAEVV
jgi:DNA modification methylase